MVRAAHSLLVLASLVATCLSQGVPPPPPPPPLIPPCIPLPAIPDPTACDVTCLVTSALHVNRAFASMRSQLKAMRQAAYYQAGPAASGPSVDISALTNLLTEIQTEVDAINPEITGLVTTISTATQASPPAPAAPDAGAGAPPA